MPTAPYSYITLAQLKAQLAARLYDPAMRFWSASELGVYISDALRTWNALTAYWRGDFTFSAATGVTWYDLTSTTQMPNTLRPLTLTDRSLYSQIQLMLLEAVAWNPWTGASAQFSADDLVTAVQNARDEILSATACTVTRRAVPATIGRTTLPDTVIDIRRVAYLPTGPSTAPSTLWPDDTWGEQSFAPTYPLAPAGTPLTYLQSTQPPISFDVDVPPAFAGSYETLTTDAGPLLTESAASPLAIPDDWTHVILWGALADLLSRESNANDPLRCAYARQRFELGKKLLGDAPALLAVRLGSTPLQIDSVWAADLYSASWQAATPATPSIVLHAGLNLFALAPPSDATPRSLLMTVVENAPLPSSDSAFVQVARDDLNAILDYAQHLAAFKQGGDEFSRSIDLLKAFMSQAALYSSKLSELGEFTAPLYGLSQRQNQMDPVTTPPVEAPQ